MSADRHPTLPAMRMQRPEGDPRDLLARCKSYFVTWEALMQRKNKIGAAAARADFNELAEMLESGS